MRTLLIAALALVAVPSYALAGGGGGTKQNGTVQVTNNSSEDLAVILDASTDDFADAQEFLDSGGQIIAQGEIATFRNVRVGRHTLSVAFINDLTGDPGTATTRSITVTKGKTLRFGVTGTSAGATISVISP
jgi:hypothetical protein